MLLMGYYVQNPQESKNYQAKEDMSSLVKKSLVNKIEK